MGLSGMKKPNIRQGMPDNPARHSGQLPDIWHPAIKTKFGPTLVMKTYKAFIITFFYWKFDTIMLIQHS